MSARRVLTCAVVAGYSLLLGGCTSLLGDFKYDPNGNNAGTGGGTSAIDQGKIVILPNAGLVTTEQGAKATFTIYLKEQPTDNVAIAFQSSNEAEGLVSPISVSFTPDNFAAPQTVQITGVDDEMPDKSQAYTILTSAASTLDPNYIGIDPLDVQVTNVDDETAGFLVTPTAGLVTSESGAEATFSIVLNHAPTADVTIDLSSDNPNEGTLSTPSLVFTPLNWMAPQMVTVTGVNDDAADGEQTYHAVTAAAVSADTAYDKLDPDNVEVKNQDNDTAGITLNPSMGLVTFESGAMTTFGIALNAPPTADVTVPLSSNDDTEGTITPSSVVFTTLNWMAPQVITITGVDDDRADGNQPYEIVTSAAVSNDGNYAGLDGPNALVINIDNDSPGITVTSDPVLVTSENGDSATFTVQLNSRPRGVVPLDIVSTRLEEGVVSPDVLTFTETNWNAPQVVTVTGVDDKVADGMQPYTVHITPNPGGEDAAYVALLESDVSLSNTDNDSAGITVVTQPGLTTTEVGGSATFTVALNSQPTAAVTIALTSNDTSEGTVTPAQLVFTADNYNAPQVVTIKGVNDSMADGNMPYRIITEPAVSDDPGYSGMNANNLDVTNIDDDSPGILVTPSNQILTTTEAGGTATFTVVLTSQPADNTDVTIGVSSTNTAEGTVSPSSLKFTTANWNAPQVVTIKGQNDDVADGAQEYRVALAAAVSTDPNYGGRDALDVTVRNTDNDSPGITLTGTTGLTTTEGGGMASFQIVLNSKPTADVRVDLSSSRTAEGTVSPASVLFTNANWNAPQTATITGQNDNVADGDQTYRVVTAPATSTDGKYSGLNAADPQVTNTDNDSAGITVTATSPVNPATGALTTTEAGGTATFTVVLNSQPTADVTLPLNSSKTTEGTISPSSVKFTATDWNAPRTITITGANDDVADGPQPYSVVTDAATSTDTNYAGRDPRDVSVSNIDNDSAGISVSPISPVGGKTTEDGGSVSFTITLNSQPKGDVSITLASSDETEATVSPTTVSFNALNWSSEKKITVTGVDDSVADGEPPYFVEINPATSPDADYDGLDAPDVSLKTVDDDSPGITVTALGDKKTYEAGVPSYTFTIVLNSQPQADVSIPISSSDTSEGTVSPSMVMFSTTNWSSAKTVTVTGVNDDVADRDQTYSIVVGAATSGDPGYDDRDGDDVALTNVDNDTAGITVKDKTGEANEDGDSMTFKVVLNSRPTASVTIDVSGSPAAQANVSPAVLTFEPADWSSPQLVTVTGVDDDVADGDPTYTVKLGAASSTDQDYDGIDPMDVSTPIVDNDSEGITIEIIDNESTETGQTASFSIVLNSQPTDNVTIPLSSSNTNEGSLDAADASVTFTPDDWNSAQVILVHGEDDSIDDGNKTYRIVTGPADSADSRYSGLNADDVEPLTNRDDEVAGITVEVLDGTTRETAIVDGDDGTASFRVVLNSQPTDSVRIPIQTSEPLEGSLEGVTFIEFTTTNWASPQTITVVGVDDDSADGDKEYAITLDNPTSADTNYTVLDPTDVPLTNVDDDSPGIEISPPPDQPLTISEDPDGTRTATFDIVLLSQPSGVVTIPLSVSDSTEATLGAVTSVKFNAADWQTTKHITVTAVDDDIKDGEQETKVLTGAIDSTDPDYDNTNPPDISLKTLDDDRAEVQVTQPDPDEKETGEAPGSPTVTFQVVLTSAPSSSVTIPLSSTAPGEGEILSPITGELVFDDTDWNVPKTVTVSGVQDDGTVDGNPMYDVVLGAAQSADSDYNGFDPEDVTGLVNIDDDVP
jgi:large repetitive protein